jgi:hypothetical protein
MSTLASTLISILSTRASSEEADPDLDLLIEVLRQRRLGVADVPGEYDRLVKEHGSAEQALAVLEHEVWPEASGRSE